ncbi:MAG: GumC family protein [Deltaproteobacteria bacterium]|nr:GumC family protein [Deltaproteobacteria bacterium]
MIEQQIPWRDLVAVLHRRRTLILQVFLAGVATVTIGLWMKGPTYRATATLMVTADRAKVAVSPDANTRPVVDRVTDEDLNSEAALLKSDALIREVLQPYWNKRPPQPTPSLFARLVNGVINLVTFPLRLPSLLYVVMHNVPASTPFDDWVAGTAQNVGVNPIPKSNLIWVSFESGDPAWAAEFVNKLVAQHIERHTRLNQQSEAREFYERQRQLLAQKSTDAESALQQFYQREHVEPTAQQRTGMRARLAELLTTLANSETELAEGTARSEFLATEIKNYPKNISTQERVAESPTAQLIKPKIVELQMQRSQLLSTYAPTSVKVQDIERQIAEAKRLMNEQKDTTSDTTTAINPAYQGLEVDLASTRAQMAAVKARVDSLQSQIADFRTKVAHLDDIASVQEHLEQQLTAAKEAYGTYAKKEEEARFSSALDDSSIVNIAIAEPAETPISPEKTKSMMIFAVGAIMSLLAGVGLAFLRDRLDPTVKSAAEAHGVTGLPILAEVSS